MAGLHRAISFLRSSPCGGDSMTRGHGVAALAWLGDRAASFLGPGQGAGRFRDEVEFGLWQLEASPDRPLEVC